MNDLDRRVATKSGEAFNMRAIEAWPDEGAARPAGRWPVRLMDVAEVGDELWWYCESDAAFAALCGMAGWALVRAGQVIDFELATIS